MLTALIAETAVRSEPATAEAAAVLLDFQHFTILLLFAGLMIGAIRGRWKKREERAGIPSQAYNIFDLCVVATILGFYYMVVFLTTQGQMTPDESVEPKPASEITPAGQFVVSLVLHGFYVGLILGMIKFGGLDRDPTTMFGLKRLKLPAIALWSLVGAIIATPAVLSLVPLMQEWLTPIFGPLAEQEGVTSIRSSDGFGLDLFFLTVSAVVIAPIAEEVIFRGYLYGVLKRFTDPMFACLTASAFFAVVHINLPALLPLLFFGIFLTLLYEATRCLWVVIGVHALFNATNILLAMRAPTSSEQDPEQLGAALFQTFQISFF